MYATAETIILVLLSTTSQVLLFIPLTALGISLVFIWLTFSQTILDIYEAVK